MPLGDKQVFLPVIVEILQPNAPARSAPRMFRTPGLKPAVAERSFAIVGKDGLSGGRRVCDDYARLAIIIVVLEPPAHPGGWPAMGVESRPRLQRDFGECAV